jgi:hypothetical protein
MVDVLELVMVFVRSGYPCADRGGEGGSRKPYPSDVSDEEWHLVLSYLTVMSEGAPQRRHGLRAAFNALRWVVRTGAQ